MSLFLTHTHTEDLGTGEWTQTGNAPFNFASNEAFPPALNRDVPEQNYLSKGIHIAGLTFMSIALSLIMISATGVFIFRNTPPLRLAQVPFLYLLLFGIGLITCAILTLSFDESFGWTESSLTAACTASPWLVALGYNMTYLALFSKLWRINKVMSPTRQKVMVHHVVGPFAASMISTVGILTAWSVWFILYNGFVRSLMRKRASRMGSAKAKMRFHLLLQSFY